MTGDLGVPADVLAAECDRLLDFGRRFPHPDGGAAWLDADGRPDLTRPVFTWVTARMTHVYCLGHLLGRAGDADLAAAGLSGLRGRLRDEKSGGWFTVDRPRRPDPRREGLLHPRLRGARRLLRPAGRAARGRRPAGGGAGRLGGAVLRRRRRAVRRRLGPRLHPDRPLPRREQQHARRRGAAGRRRRDRRRDAARAGPGDRPPGGAGLRRAARLADPGALRPAVAAAAGAQPDRARRPVPAVRRDRRPRPGVVAAGAAPGGGAGRPRSGLAGSGVGRPVRPGRGRRLGGRRRRRLRLHHRLGRTARGPRPDALGAGRGLRRRGGAAPADRGGPLRRARPDLVGVRGTPPDRPRPRLLAPPARRPERRSSTPSGRASPTSTTPSRRP